MTGGAGGTEGPGGAGGGPDPLRLRARESPDRLAVVLPEGGDSHPVRLTFAELDDLADRLARRIGERVLGSAGPRPEGANSIDPPTLAIVLPPSLEAVALVFAAGRAGMRLAPLNPRLTPSELQGLIDRIRPPLIIRDPVELDAVGAGGTEKPGWPHRTDGREVHLHPAEPELPRFLLWTSGTRGRPRCVRLSMDNLLAIARGSRERLDLRADDRWLASLSLAHVGGLALVIRAVHVGSGLVVRERFDAADFNRLADEGAITHASMVPTMLRRVLDDREGRPAPSSLRCLLVGGDHTPEALLERALEAGFPVALTYGLTEASSQVATAGPELVRRKPGTVGASLPGVRLRIAANGEILVRGPTVAAGEVDIVDGWLRTGDIGELDDDAHLRVTGRLSDRIISGGFNVDPAEVEEVLRRHPDVADAAVVGLDDPEWGERVVAAVVVEKPAAVPAPELDAHCRRYLAGPKRPRSISVVDSLPRNPNGKVDRSALRVLLSERSTA